MTLSALSWLTSRSAAAWPRGGKNDVPDSDRRLRAAAGQAGANYEEDEPEVLRDARQRYRRSEAGLERARSLRQGPAAVFKWSGIVLALLGGVGHFVVRSLAE